MPAPVFAALGLLMINRDSIKKDPTNDKYWIPILDGVGVYFEQSKSEPNQKAIDLVNGTIDVLETLYREAIKYIDIWVDRTKEGVGTENELHSIYLDVEEGYTTLEIHFYDDHESLWWVRFANPSERRIGGYWPQEFGRKQM